MSALLKSVETKSALNFKINLWISVFDKKKKKTHQTNNTLRLYWRVSFHSCFIYVYLFTQAGNGILATNIIGDFIEYRGQVWR